MPAPTRSFVAGWIAETQAERQRYLQQLSAKPVERPQPEPLTLQQIGELLAGLGDLVGVLRDADPEHKLSVYAALKLRLDYEPETQTVRAHVDLGQHRGDLVSVRGLTRGIFTL